MVGSHEGKGMDFVIVCQVDLLIITYRWCNRREMYLGCRLFDFQSRAIKVAEDVCSLICWSPRSRDYQST